MNYLDSPSGRKSSRRALYAVAVVVGCAVNVLGMLIASTASAALVGRFAERGTERDASTAQVAHNDEDRGGR